VNVATDREWELESKLWDTLCVMQSYVVSVRLGQHEHAAKDFNLMLDYINHWREHFDWYMQHPKWDESGTVDDR
jgi:hypothetical protein